MKAFCAIRVFWKNWWLANFCVTWRDKVSILPTTRGNNKIFALKNIFLHFSCLFRICLVCCLWYKAFFIQHVKQPCLEGSLVNFTATGPGNQTYPLSIQTTQLLLHCRSFWPNPFHTCQQMLWKRRLTAYLTNAHAFSKVLSNLKFEHMLIEKLL